MLTIEPTPIIPETVHFRSFADKESLAECLARDVCNELRHAITQSGMAGLVVSGGLTPKPFFEAFKQSPLEWDKLVMTLADERWVEVDHNDSNEKMVRDMQFSPKMRFIPLKNETFTAHAGARLTDKALEDFPTPIDVVILGMGEDGHTASLFPNAAELNDALNPRHGERCIGLTPPEYAPHDRVTLTLPYLLNAKKIILHITGAKKLEVFEMACKAGAVEAMPIRAFLRQEQTPVDVYWAA